MLHRIIRSIFNRHEPQSQISESLFDDEITRYPPFAKGFPVAPVAVLIDGQKDLIKQIKATLSFNESEFSVLIQPVIERYAAFVHLLPASESHHHRGSGGLFRHGLEVGLYAAQIAQAYQFCVGETPTKKRDMEPRWQVAAFFGGLLHDLGKPFYDVAVVDKSGTEVWNAQNISLLDWANTKQVDRYFIRWRDKRKTRHKSFSTYSLSKVLTTEAETYLNEPDAEIMSALIEAVEGVIATYELTNIVIQSDQASIKEDMKSSKELPNENAFGVPVEMYIFNAIRRTIPSRKINQQGGLIWVVDQGVFVAWKQIIAEINSILDEDHIAGIPRNPDTLADILTERGYVIPYQKDAEARPERYWKIYPEILNGVHQECIKLDDPGRIFQSEPPVPIKASLSPIEDDLVRVEETNVKAHENKTEPESCEPESIASQTRQASKEASHEEYSQTQQSRNIPLNALGKYEKQTQGVDKSIDDDNSTAALYEEYQEDVPERGDGPGWDMVDKAIAVTRKGKHAVEKLPDGEYAIPYPSGAKLLGHQKDVMNLLFEGDMLKKDLFSTSKTTTVSGKKYLILTGMLKKYISYHLTVPEQQLLTLENEIFIAPKTASEAFDQLIDQATKGYGCFIDGEVEHHDDDGISTYFVSERCLQLIEAQTGLANSSLKLAIRDRQDSIELLYKEQKLRIRIS